MYNCLVVDDTLLQRDLMVMHLGKIRELNIAAVYANGLDAYQHLVKESVDIVFSDIHMPELGGLELLKSLQSSPVFIFVSDYPEYAAESYALDVIDYIVKPVSFDRLLKAANKAIEYLNLKKQAAEQKNHPSGNENHFFIRESSDIVKLKFDQVAYIESMGNFSKIHMLSGKPHLALIILKNLESQLPQSFFARVHKQYIINHTHISKIMNDELVIADRFTIPLSHSYRQTILDKIVQHKIINRNLMS